MKRPERSRGQIIPKDAEIPHRKFLVRVYVGRTNGKRQYASETVEGTYKQAEAKRTEMLRELDTQTFVAPTKTTVKAYVEGWLQTKADLADRTAGDYARRMKLDVYPSLGSTKLQDVSAQRVRLLYASMAKRGLGARTIQYTHAILTQALSQAVDDGLLRKNPCLSATSAIPSIQKRSGGEALSVEEMRTVLTSATEGKDKYRALWFLLLGTGMRPGEALALRWADLPGSAVTITRAVTVDRHHKSYIAEMPKNSGSCRRVELDPMVVEALQEHRKEQLKGILKAGASYDRASDLIFATKTGRWFFEHNVRRMWKRRLKLAGVRAVRLYDTRHTHISHLLGQGVSAKTVAERSGHANANVLLSTYAHVLPGAGAAAASLFGSLMQGGSDAGRAHLVGDEGNREVVRKVL